MRTKIAGYALLAITCITGISSCKKTVTPTITPLPAAASTPVINTLAATAVTETTASCGGNVVSEGASVLIAVGVCWDTLPNPTILRPRTVEGAGTGNFTSKITGLKPNTTYYVRAYATNYSGTAYGAEVSFKTSLAWVRVNPAGNSLHLFDMMNSGTVLLAGNELASSIKVVSSNDNGATWVDANNGINNTFIMSVFANSSTAFAVTGSGLYKSSNNGQQWTLINDNTLSSLTCFTQHNSNVIGGGSNGIRINSAGSSVWTTSNSGLGSNKSVNALLSTGNTLLAGTSSGCYKSTNDGATWSLSNSGLGSEEVLSFGMVNSTLFACIRNNNVFSSSDNGTTWTQVNTLNQSDMIGFVSKGNNIYGYSRDKGVFASVDGGVTWTPMGGLPSLMIRTMAIKDALLIINADNGGVYTYPM